LEIPSHGPIDYGNKKCSKKYNFLQQEESEEMHLIHNKRHDVDAGTDYKQNLESRAGAVLLVVVVVVSLLCPWFLPRLQTLTFLNKNASSRSQNPGDESRSQIEDDPRDGRVFFLFSFFFFFSPSIL
jgi:hypothetical protein